MAKHDNVKSGAIDVKHSAVARDNWGSIEVSQCEVNYLKPARPDEIHHIRTPDTVLGGMTMWANNSYAAGANLARLTIRVGCIGPTGRIDRFPKDLRIAIGHFHAVDSLLAREGA